MIPFFSAFLGLLIGATLGRHGGWFYGLLAGLGVGLAWQLQLRYRHLARELDTLRRRVAAMGQLPSAGPAADTARQRGAEAEPQAEPPPAPDLTASDINRDAARGAAVEKPAPPPAAPVSETPRAPAAAASLSADRPSVTAHVADPRVQEPMPAQEWLNAAQRFFTTGNLLAKVGVVVLFFGVAFLLKYIAERELLSVAVRLGGVALIGVVMLVVGLRLRHRNPLYALVVQGGGVGVLYLTTFAAFRLYHLLPPAMAFAVLVALTALGVALAVWQNALALAVLAVSGGFLAPVLASTGSGSHVALFSYYLVLNLGILAIAWFRAWRELNLVGFIFTFGIGTLWGAKYYRPEFYTTIEPFLVAHFLLYLAVSVLFAFRQPPRLKGYVDGTLVFALPLAAFALQTELVAGFAYGLAWSSATLAVLYAVLAKVLWARLKPESRLICEAFVALAVSFTTLTVPLALDAQWTSGMWALEGAALVWIGCRQRRALARASGYLLQWAAALALWFGWPALARDESLAFINAEYLGMVTVALSGLFVAGYLNRQRDHLIVGEGVGLAHLFLVWGMLWWYGAGIYELHQSLPADDEIAGLMGFFTISSVIAHSLQGRLNWPQMRFPAHSLLFLLYLLWPWAVIQHGHVVEGWLGVAWPLAMLGHYWILRRYDDWQTPVLSFLHMGGLWLVMALISWEVTLHIDEALAGSLWPQLAVGVVPALLMLAVYAGRCWWPWPLRAHPWRYLHTALIPVAAVLVVWLWAVNVYSRGMPPAPLMYWPVLNPLDIADAVVLAVLGYWLWRPAPEMAGSSWRFLFAPTLLGVLVFGWLNSQWLRFAHHFLGVPFREQALWESVQVQAGLSILWSLTGLGCMLYGARRSLRRVWVAGAIVMALVVIKLFLVDLSGTGTLARVVSFLSVGGLLLVVGYFMPAPPREGGAETASERA